MMLLAPFLALILIAADDAPMPAPRLVAPPHLGPDTKPDEVWHLTLPEAIRIGLENSEVVRCLWIGAQPISVGGVEPDFAGPVVPAGAATPDLADGPLENVPPATVGPHPSPMGIARINGDASIWSFKAAIMAHVRSVEQQYWALSAMNITLWSRETAVRLISELHQQAQADLKAGRIKPEALAQVEEALENAQLNLVTATSDLVTTERQLRNILGLAAVGKRRIVPDTAPTETKVEPDWFQSAQQMYAAQPDIAQQRELVAKTDLLAVIATGPADDQAHPRRERQQAQLRQVVREATHVLARFFLEVDANYKQFQAAQRSRAAAQGRFEIQRVAYENRELTIDRLLDAVAQYANGIAQEAQYKSSYNTSIAALEEAKGTILAYEGITLSARPAPRASVAETKATPAAAEAKPPTAPTTYKLRAAVAGVKLLDVEVEINRPNAPTAR